MQRLTIFLAALLLGSLETSLASAQETVERPNILVCLGDDISWHDFGCYGHPVRTPHIDALAKNGLRFTHAFLTTSSCSPTRISVLTGKYPHATGAEDLHMPLPADEVFVSTYLEKVGYYTGHMQKTHYGPNGVKQFEWYSKNPRDFPKFLDEAGQKPFFMWVGFRDAHRPYRKGTLDPPHDLSEVYVPPFLADTPETRADIAMYYDEIGRMDSDIGFMVEELKRRGEFENTLIVVFCDNGMPFPRAKGTLYDSGIGTPLVVSWPKRIKQPAAPSGLVSVIDLAPTWLAAAGLDKPAAMQGRSILPQFTGASRQGREYVFAERNWHNCDHHMRCVRSKNWKLIKNAYLEVPFGHPADCSNSPSWHSLLKLKEAGELTPEQLLIFQTPRPEYELYDLEADPHEFNNLADDPAHAERVKKLAAVLEEWRDETGDFPAERRRRADNTNRVTGVKFTKEIAPLEQ